MTRTWKNLFCIGLLAVGVRSAIGFSLLGPVNELYQIQDLGFALPWDVGAPKNLNEEYRRTVPVLYYSFNQNFLDYFGSNGVRAVEEAFAILNSLNDVSSYSSNLAEFPLQSRLINYRANVLGLKDVKSETLGLMMEQLGLAQPERFTWVLHDRFIGAGGCPNAMDYLVTRRNFEIVPSNLDQLQYSSYVNGTLFTYYIRELCTSPVLPISDAVELPVDPLNETYTAVASLRVDTLNLGHFYAGLTRDDVAGLRYLLRANNVNYENAGPNTVTVATNLGAPQLLYTSNLTELVEQALTNTAAALVALNPGLVVASTTPIFTNYVTTNTIFVFTNRPFDPVGAPAFLMPVAILTTNITTWYRHEFANVFTNRYTEYGFVTNQTTNISTTACGPYQPAGTVCTNISNTGVWTNMLQGDYYLVPFLSNLCGFSIISNMPGEIQYTLTNAVLTATNVQTTTNVGFQQFSQITLYTFTQHVFVAFPLVCETNSAALRQGVEKVTFVRRDYDSLLGRFFVPITNQYVANTISNSTLVPLRAQRVVTQPDILFSAQDYIPGPAVNPRLFFPDVTRNVSFGTSNTLPNLAGPGTIESSTTITFNKGGPYYWNFTTNNFYFLDEWSASVFPMWASFDETTNAPIVYPNGTSIEALENQIIMGITTADQLPAGQVGTNYVVQLAGQGGTLPYVWSLAPLSPGLPAGLGLSGGGEISGIPAAAGTYDFTIRMTDAGARYVERAFTLTINP